MEVEKGQTLVNGPDSGFPGCARRGEMSGKGASARVALLTNGNISVTAEVFVDQMTSLCKFKHGLRTRGVTWLSARQFLPMAVGRRSLLLHSQHLQLGGSTFTTKGIDCKRVVNVSFISAH